MSIISNHSMSFSHSFRLSTSLRRSQSIPKKSIIIANLKRFLSSVSRQWNFSDKVIYESSIKLQWIPFSVLLISFPKRRKANMKNDKRKNKFRWKFCVYGFLFRLVLFMCINRKTNNKESFCVLAKVGELFSVAT